MCTAIALLCTFPLRPLPSSFLGRHSREKTASPWKISLPTDFRLHLPPGLGRDPKGEPHTGTLVRLVARTRAHDPMLDEMLLIFARRFASSMSHECSQTSGPRNWTRQDHSSIRTLFQGPGPAHTSADRLLLAVRRWTPPLQISPWQK